MTIDPAVLARVSEARASEVPAPTGEPDPTTVVGGLVDGWLADLDDALARLLVAGLAHPDAELPATLELLAARAAGLGAGTAARGLGALAVWTDALRPGPPDLASRVEIAGHAWDEAMRLVAWVRAFRADLALTAAAVTARGVDGSEVEDVTPRLSGRVWVDGLTLVDGRLTIVGHTADDDPVLLIDPLADASPDDPFGRPVISRLFQDVLELGELGRSVLELERQPVSARGATLWVHPAFRAVPRRVPALGEGPPTRHVQRAEVHASVDGEDVTLRDRAGRAIGAGRTLRFNVLKRLAADGAAGVRFEVALGARQDGPIVIAAIAPDARSFPHVDPRAWRIDPAVLGHAVADGPLWLRAAAGLFGGVGPAGMASVWAELRRPLTGPDRWRLGWWAARQGAALDRPPGLADDTPHDAFTSVWWACMSGDTNALNQAWDLRYAVLPDPAPTDVAARALVLDARGDRPGAVVYLDAHLDRLRQDVSVRGVLPDPFDLLALADVRAQLRDLDRSSPIVDGLDLPVVPLREAVAWALYRARVRHDLPDAQLADWLAVAASSRVGGFIIGPSR